MGKCLVDNLKLQQFLGVDFYILYSSKPANVSEESWCAVKLGAACAC